MTTHSRESTRVVLRRGLQVVVDWALYVVASIVFAIVVVLLLIALGFQGRWILHAGIGGYVAGLVICSVLNEVLLPLRTGATVGMEVTGLRITMLDGRSPTAGRYLIRHLLWVVDGQLWGLAGLGVMCCTRYHQRVGDLVAGTAVIRKPEQPRPSADQAVLPRPDGELRPVAQTELALGAGQVRLDGRQ